MLPDISACPALISTKACAKGFGSLLAQWLWSTLLRHEFIGIREHMNTQRGRKDKKKALPSGTTSKEVYFLPEKFGMEQCLRAVDISDIEEAKAAIGGQALLDFVPPEYAVHAEKIIQQFGGTGTLSYENIWDAFCFMLPHMPV
jgi:hypothetical protein